MLTLSPDVDRKNLDPRIAKVQNPHRCAEFRHPGKIISVQNGFAVDLVPLIWSLERSALVWADCSALSNMIPILSISVAAPKIYSGASTRQTEQGQLISPSELPSEPKVNIGVPFMQSLSQNDSNYETS